jgi:lipid-A-disaccharide synthase
MLADVRDVGLVNIVAGKRLVPELVQGDFRVESIVPRILSYLQDQAGTASLRRELVALRARLGSKGCFRRASGAIELVLHAPRSERAPSVPHG